MTEATSRKVVQQDRQGQVERLSQELCPQPAMSGAYGDILALQQSIGNDAVNALMQGSIPSIVQSVVNSGGQPIERPVRAQMESRFGQDFSHVRVHTDGRAAASAHAVHAKAYTVGSDVVFSASRYAPET